MKSQSGFSLVELMVAVAIIAIITTVAVPKMQKYRAQAGQKTALATLKMAYKVYQAEYALNNSPPLVANVQGQLIEDSASPYQLDFSAYPTGVFVESTANPCPSSTGKDRITIDLETGNVTPTPLADPCP
jgi:prepilin-type N-terminal cleavage/methylation domain-containing protein